MTGKFEANLPEPPKLEGSFRRGGFSVLTTSKGPRDFVLAEAGLEEKKRMQAGITGSFAFHLTPSFVRIKSRNCASQSGGHTAKILLVNNPVMTYEESADA